MNKLKLARFFLSLFKLIPLTHKLKSKQEFQPFFVFGSGRNGSTLLNRLLNESSDLFVPPEQYFLGPMIYKYHFYNYLLWNDLVKVIIGEVFLKKKETWQFDPTATLLKAVNLPEKDRSLQSLITNVFNDYGKQCGKGSRWGDTTSPNTKYAKEIYQLFPKAKYLFLIRDGRDVVASYKTAGTEAFGANALVENSTKKWLDSIRTYEWLSKRREVLLVKYEDLVENTEEMLVKICAFIEAEPIEGWENYVHHIPESEFYNQEYLKRTKEQVFSDSIGRWKTVLAEDEQAFTSQKMEKKLIALGYKPSIEV